MPLKPEYDGDVMKVPGAFLTIAKNMQTDEFIGLYAITHEGTFIRGNGVWITATGPALYQLHGAQLVRMNPEFIESYDVMDAAGRTPTDDEITDGSNATPMAPASK